MYSFFVLGIIPGTNIQITLTTWLDSLALLVAIAALVWLNRQHRFRNFILARQSIRPNPVHASQLHQRGQ
jgi:hypothetical protein